jgi:hypothetical protein
MVWIVENSHVKYILNRISGKLRCGGKMIGSVNKEHIRTSHKFVGRVSY